MSLICNTSLKKADPTCQGCPWYDEGELTAPIFASSVNQPTFVIENPSMEDFAYGEPLSSERGEMVESWLSPEGEAGFSLSQCSKLYAVKCSNGSKKPGIKVLRACSEHLKTDIEYAQKMGSPITVSLGATATRAFITVKLFSSLQGSPLSVKFGKSDILLFPTLSPGQILARPADEGLVRKDFQNIIKLAQGESLEEFNSRGVTELVLLSTREKVIDFFTKVLPESRVVSFDVETTGFDPDLDQVTGNALNYLDSKLLTLNFSVKEGEGVVLPLLGAAAKKIWSDVFMDEISEMVKAVMENPEILWVIHNSGFDVPFVVENYGVDLFKMKYVDSLLQSHLLWEEAPKDLKSLAKIHTNLGGYESVLGN